MKWQRAANSYPRRPKGKTRHPGDDDDDGRDLYFDDGDDLMMMVMAPMVIMVDEAAMVVSEVAWLGSGKVAVLFLLEGIQSSLQSG